MSSEREPGARTHPQALQRDPGPRTGRSGGPLGGLLAASGGLLLAGATVAAWVARTDTRELVGVEISEVITTSGVEFSPWTVPVGVLATIGGLLLVMLPAGVRALRRLIGVLLALAGVAGLLSLALGLRSAVGADGQLRAAPWLAVVGALAVTAGGVVAVKRRQRREPVLGARYDIDVPAAEADPSEEWGMAAAEEDDLP